MTPTQRTFEALREQGYYCGTDSIVERRIKKGQFSFCKDFLGIIDIIALKEGEILGVQCCGKYGFIDHNKTIMESYKDQIWLKSGGKLQLWAWRQLKKQRGKKAMYWCPRIKIYTLEDFNKSCKD